MRQTYHLTATVWRGHSWAGGGTGTVVRARTGEVTEACGTLKKLPDSALGTKEALLEKGCPICNS